MLARVSLDSLHERFFATRESHVCERLFVDREKSAGCTIFRRHVCNRCAVCKRHVRESSSEEFHKLIHNSMRAQQLGHTQHKIRGGCSFGKFASQPNSNNLWNQHINRLSEHYGLGFDSTNSPTKHAQSIDHRCVTICTDKAVRIENSIFFPNHFCEIFQVDLMNDARSRWHDSEIAECALPPLQEFIALHIALKFLLVIDCQRNATAIRIDLHRMINHKIARNKRIDALGISTHSLHRTTHRSKINNARNTSEIL